jgi:hypothetical protein
MTNIQVWGFVKTVLGFAFIVGQNRGPFSIFVWIVVKEICIVATRAEKRMWICTEGIVLFISSFVRRETLLP